MSTDPVSPEPATWVTDPREPVRVWLTAFNTGVHRGEPDAGEDITTFQAAADAIRLLFPSTAQPINLEPVSGRPDGEWLVDLPRAIYDLVALGTEFEVSASAPDGRTLIADVTLHS